MQTCSWKPSFELMQFSVENLVLNECNLQRKYSCFTLINFKLSKSPNTPKISTLKNTALKPFCYPKKLWSYCILQKKKKIEYFLFYSNWTSFSHFQENSFWVKDTVSRDFRSLIFCSKDSTWHLSAQSFLADTDCA